MPRSRAVWVGAVVLALAAPASGQAAHADLVGVWVDVRPASHDGDPSAATVYREVAFTGAEMTWTFVTEFTTESGRWLLADRYGVRYRADGDRIVTPGDVVTTARITGDTLVITTTPPGEPATAHTMVRAPLPADLTGDWTAGPEDLPLAAALGVGYRLLPDGAVRELPGGQDVGGYIVAGPFVLLYRHLPPEDAALGLETTYTPAALERVGGEVRLVLTFSDRPPLVLRRR